MSELSSLLASILPYAIGALFSPLILVTLLTTISPSRSPRLSAFAYLFGSIIIFLILVFFGLFTGATLSPTILGPITVGGLIEIVLGIILVIIGLKTLFVQEESREGGLIGFINSLPENNNLSIFLKFFYFGLITFFASFTTAILITIAGIIIGLSNPGSANSAIIIITLGFISLLVVEIPFIFYILSPGTAEDTLGRFRSWIPMYGEYLTSIVYFLLGIFFLVRGFYSF
jgi:hypothetical protein